MTRRQILSSTLALFAFAVVAHADEPAPHKKDMDGVAIFPAAGIKWKDGPPSLQKGAQVAVLEGDPAKEGPFVLRVKMPDGFKIAPHTHPMTERLTVISGMFYLGMGEKFDSKDGLEMPAGSFGYWKEGMKHFAWVKGETVIQLHGTGPWTLKYVNPEDDPRNQKK
jgi:quercetin dioxygenase-like cupin family protein